MKIRAYKENTNKTIPKSTKEKQLWIQRTAKQDTTTQLPGKNNEMQ